MTEVPEEMTRLERLRLREIHENPHHVGREVLVCLVLLMIGLCVWCVWNIWTIAASDAQDMRRTEHLRVVAGVAWDPGTAATGSIVSVSEAPVAPASSGADVSAAASAPDMQAVLREIPAARAWLSVPGTDIEYPIMQGANNEYYLTHAASGEKSRAGAIFMSWENTDDFLDGNTVLYGHRMNNGAMFGGLDRYRDSAFLDAHSVIRVTLPDGTVRTYEVCAVQEIEARADHPAYRTSFSDAEDFSAWAERPREGLVCARTCPPSEAYLTLSTCVAGRSDARLIVQAAYREERSTN